MPFLPQSEYKPPLLFTLPHVQTIYPTLFRRVAPAYVRKQIPTPDGDVLDLDWLTANSNACAIICHGLEGSSQSSYVQGMAQALFTRGVDVLAWNFRGCGGAPNKTLRFYHSGATDDLHTIVSHVQSLFQYDALYLVGFSLGGNMMLKYLGENLYPLPSTLRRVVAFSVPCDLAACSAELARPQNAIYMRRFLRHLHAKIRAKMDIMPGAINDDNYSSIRTFQDFDDRYTAPLHGFRDADHYWSVCSCKQYLPSIRIPTLLVNANDDPFLAPSAYPVEEARNSLAFFLDVPRYGGHCGFVLFNEEREYWSEKRALQFLLSD